MLRVYIQFPANRRGIGQAVRGLNCSARCVMMAVASPSLGSPSQSGRYSSTRQPTNAFSSTNPGNRARLIFEVLFNSRFGICGIA